MTHGVRALAMRPFEKLSTAEEVAKVPILGRTTLAASAAWAPDAGRPPFFMDLPTQDGQPQPDVLARYTANAPSVLVAQYAAQLKKYKSIMMDVGLQDGLIAGNLETDHAPDSPGGGTQLREFRRRSHEPGR